MRVLRVHEDSDKTTKRLFGVVNGRKQGQKGGENALDNDDENYVNNEIEDVFWSDFGMGSDNNCLLSDKALERTVARCFKSRIKRRDVSLSGIDIVSFRCSISASRRRYLRRIGGIGNAKRIYENSVGKQNYNSSSSARNI